MKAASLEIEHEHGGSAPSLTSTQVETVLAPRVRYIGVDLARFLAVVGMIAAHVLAVNAMSSAVGPFERFVSGVADALTGGIAAPLFAVLGGLSAVFASRRLLIDSRPWAAISGVMLRGALLIAIGLLLGFVSSPIVVVLCYYGVAMILAAPFVAARSWVIAAAAALVGIFGGWLNASIRSALGVVQEAGSPSFLSLLAEPLETVRGLLLTGMYPAITWLVYLLVGMLVARVLLSANARGSLVRTSGTIAGLGAILAIAASTVSASVLSNLAHFEVTAPEGLSEAEYLSFLGGQQFGSPLSPELWSQLIAAPHSGSPMDLLRTIGISLAVIGLLVAIFDRQNARAGRVTEVIRAAGAAPLTIYAMHIMLTGLAYVPVFSDERYFTGELAIPWWVGGSAAFAIQLALVLVVGFALARLHRRGPLEALLSQTVKLATRS